MIKANSNKRNNLKHSVRLYKGVFYSRVSTAVVLLLVFSFFLQPIERIYASEIDVDSNTVTASDTSEVVNLAVDSSLPDNGSSDADVESESVSDTDVLLVEDESAQVTELEPVSDDSSSVADTATETEEVSENNPEVLPDSPPEQIEEDISTTTLMTDVEIQDLINSENSVSDINTTDESEVVPEVVDTSSAVPVTNVNSDALMQFNKDNCVTVEDGSFYCQTKTKDTVAADDGLYALQDVDGDLEIYMKKDGDLKQVTFNKVDDAAPYFDSKSNSIVWHRLVDDRYQVVSYDVSSGEEIQLTADNVNNMEPTRYGKYTVWQRWHNNNWDIVLYDGTETRFLTDSFMHDIAPKINSSLVVWNRLSVDNTQTIELYDIDTDEYTTISDEEGGALSNPRMVLVYETEFANGDVVTKGYDMDTGKIEPLSTKAADIPDEIPAPDATGETRALIQGKNQTKDDGEMADDLVPNNNVGGGNDPIVPSSDIKNASSTLDLSALNMATTSVGEPVLDVEDMTLDLSIVPSVSETPAVAGVDSLTLVIEPLATNTEAVISDITE